MQMLLAAGCPMRAYWRYNLVACTVYQRRAGILAEVSPREDVILSASPEKHLPGV